MTLHARDVLLLYVTAPGTAGRTHVFQIPEDCRWTITAPGGFDTLTGTILWPDRSRPPSDILQGDAICQVVDRRTGDILWWGTLDEPGENINASSTAGYRITATGSRRVLEHVSKAYALCDRDLRSWVWDGKWTQASPLQGDGEGFVANSIDWPTDDPTGYIELPLPDGATVKTNATQGIRYRPLAFSHDRNDPDLKAVWFMGSHMASAAGGATNRAQVQIINGATVTTVTDDPWSATQLNYSLPEGGGLWTDLAKQIVLRWIYTGAGGTRTSDGWVRWANLAVYFQAYDKNGNVLSANNSYLALTPGGVMHDMLGRFMVGKVEAGATVFYPNTTKIDQAAWWGGVSAREIADFVQSVQPDHWWAMWEPGPSGKPRFEYRPWQTFGNGIATNFFRYYVTPADSRIQLSGGAADLYNRAVVVYERSDGVPASTVVSGVVKELDYLKATRTAVVDLTGRGPLTQTTAGTLGLSELSQLNQQRSSGTVTVTAPIMDRVTGRTVHPWELLPGWLTRTAVPKSAPLIVQDFSLPDGEASFRTTSVTFDVRSNSAELALDGGVKTLFSRRRSPAAPVRRGEPRLVPQLPGAKVRTAQK